ncbi:MAG TPA: hypothetical protein VJI69_02305, partial [Bacteroidia bacterium]|nr:hypothetical protein [Bacteroidia bacterium]
VSETDELVHSSHFRYYFDKNKNFFIDEISSGSEPKVVERNVGQFGMFTIGHAQSTDSNVVKAEIRYDLVISQAGLGSYDETGYGEEALYKSIAGKSVVDILRDLKLYTILKHLHQKLHEKYSSFPTFENMANPNYFQPLEDNYSNISLSIKFTITTKSGNVTRRYLKLVFHGAGNQS